MRLTRLPQAAALLIVVALTAGPSAAGAQAPATSPFAGLSFLLGTWDAAPDPINGTGHCTFAEDLQGHAIVRTNHADTPAANGRPASTHDDLMVIYKGASLNADYFDNEDHAIHYVVMTPRPGVAVFLAVGSASTPGYRLTYKLDSARVVSGQFEVAAPGTTTFATYLSWKMNKR